jgi:DNA-binding response OmpR family regulator
MICQKESHTYTYEQAIPHQHVKSQNVLTVSHPQGRTSPRVLIIDDNIEVCDVLRLCLDLQGFNVMTALNSGEALDAIADTAPDIVLLDHNLPRTSCANVLSMIRAILPGVPIVLISGIYDLKDRARQLKVQYFLSKPFDLDKLVLLLRSLITDQTTEDLSSHARTILADCSSAALPVVSC